MRAQQADTRGLASAQIPLTHKTLLPMTANRREPQNAPKQASGPRAAASD